MGVTFGNPYKSFFDAGLQYRVVYHYVANVQLAPYKFTIRDETFRWPCRDLLRPRKVDQTRAASKHTIHHGLDVGLMLLRLGL